MPAVSLAGQQAAPHTAANRIKYSLQGQMMPHSKLLSDVRHVKIVVLGLKTATPAAVALKAPKLSCLISPLKTLAALTVAATAPGAQTDRPSG